MATKDQGKTISDVSEVEQTIRKGFAQGVEESKAKPQKETPSNKDAVDEEQDEHLDEQEEDASARMQAFGVVDAEVEDANIAAIVRGGIGNEVLIEDNTVIDVPSKGGTKEEEGLEAALAPLDDGDGVKRKETTPKVTQTAVKGGKVKNSNIAAVVYGGMENKKTIRGNLVINARK